MISKMASSASLLGLKESAFIVRARRLGLSSSTASGVGGNGGRTHSAGFVFNDLYVPLVVKLVEAAYQGTLDNFAKISGRLNSLFGCADVIIELVVHQADSCYINV